MDEEQLMQYIEKCRKNMESKQAEFEQQYNLAQYPTYWGDENSIVLKSKSDNIEKYEFEVVFIGKHDRDDRFMWSWADERLSDDARKKSSKIRKLASITGFTQFDIPIIELSPPKLEQIIPVVLDHLNAIACFVDKSKEPLLFVAIKSPGVKDRISKDEVESLTEEEKMREPVEFLKEMLDILKNSEDENLEGLFHGINLPPNWFEMVAPKFTDLFGMQLKGSIISIDELEDHQLDALRMAPQDVQTNLKHAIKLEYTVPDSDQNESGTLTLPICLMGDSYKILLVGG